MLYVAVIADDLTGAADTGIQFCRVFRPGYLMGNLTVARVRFPHPPGVLSVYTNSRHLSAKAADESVRSAMRYFNTLQPQSIYKKIDSCLRGNIGAEIDAALEASGYKICFVAPAFPAQGRTTIHGVHYLHGIPLAETEMARDPVSPVTGSNLSELLASQSRFKIGRIDVDIFAQGERRLELEVDHCIKDGCRHIVFDADTQQHLDRIAQLGVTVFPKTLLVGSAGLAAGMTSVMGGDPLQESSSKVSINGNMLWVCGSTSERLGDQVQQLVKQNGLPKMELSPAMLVDPDQITARLKLAGDAIGRLAQKSLVLQVSRVLDGRNAFSAGDVLQGLAHLVDDIVTKAFPAGLFLSGGDTADAVLRRIGTQFIILQNEVLPGLIGGILSGGLMDERPVVTKSGAFGKSDDLAELYRRLKNERNFA